MDANIWRLMRNQKIKQIISTYSTIMSNKWLVMFRVCKLRTFYTAPHSCGTSGLRTEWSAEKEIRETAG